MLDTLNLPIFIASGLLLNLTPGADVLYITSKSAGQGLRAGAVAALGIGGGGMVHILCAAFGLSAILATSAFAFTVVKALGGAYLVYLGISTLLSIRSKKQQHVPSCARSQTPLASIFRQAILVNVLNPKVALFFLAFLPQFVAPNASHPALSFLFLGLIFNINGTIVNLIFALVSAKIASQVRIGGWMPSILKTGIGSLFLWLGVKLVMTAQR